MALPKISMVFFIAAGAFLIWGGLDRRGVLSGEEPHEIANPTKIPDAPPAPALSAPDFHWTFNALDPGRKRSARAAALFDPADDYWGLPRETGYDLVAAYCASCHSLQIVMEQRATPERWRELLDWMSKTQGMAPPPPEDRVLIEEYLSAQFGP